MIAPPLPRVVLAVALVASGAARVATRRHPTQRCCLLTEYFATGGGGL